MAKPETAGAKAKKAKDWTAKGWTELTIPAGSTEATAVSFDPDTQDLAVKGQVFGADGTMLTGHGRPKVVVEQTSDGGTIALREAADQDVRVLYKVGDEDEEEEEEPVG